MKGKSSWLSVLAITFVPAIFGAMSWTTAASGASYYEGKTIRILVSSSPGGGTDTAGRLAGRFLPKFLPGNPTTIVQNMPGGGGTISNNYFTRHAKPDGFHLLMDSTSGLVSFVRGGSRIKYNPQKYPAVGSIMRGGSLLMVRKEARHRLADAKAKPLVVGENDGSRNWVAMILWGGEHLGWNARFILGYAGTGEMVLALRQGEIEFWATSNSKLVHDMVKDGLVDVIAVQDAKRRLDFPDVPTFLELLGDKRPSGVSWQAYQVWAGPAEVDKFLVAPPGTPDKIVSLLREAFVKAAESPEFKSQATKFFGDGWIVREGEKTEALIQQVTTASAEVKEFTRKLRKKYGLPTVKP